MEIKLQFTSKINEGFLRLIMKAPKTGKIDISRANEIGKYICSMTRYSNLPVKQSSGTMLNLPKTTLESAENYFIYFTVEDQKKINDYLAAQFDLFFHRMMLTGDEHDIKKNKLIDSIVARLNLMDDTKIFDNLKKKDYRKRKNVENFLLKTLQIAV